MTQQDALYRAVCEHPNEDTPRLIFADLVEEEGDSLRAAFIRTQVELARVPDYDPLWAQCRRRNPDALRGWGMAHTLPQLPDGFSWRAFQFSRGFPWRASVLKLDAFLRSGEQLFKSAPIQALELDHTCGIAKQFTPFVECPHLERIHRLEFAHTRFSELPMKQLGRSAYAANLTELAFEGHAIESEGLRMLAESPLFSRLRSLELSLVALSPALLIDALAAAPEGNLQTLSLANCKLPAPDAAHLFSLPLMAGVTSLDLSDNPIQTAGFESLIPCLRVGLETIKLRSTYPGVPGVKALAKSASLKGLRWLDLSSNRLGPTAIKLLAESEYTRGLRVLDLSNNPVGEAGARALAESPHLEGLAELALTGCDIGRSGPALAKRFGDRLTC